MHEIVFDASLDSVLQDRACNKCREHKLKCDRRVPCGTCQRKTIACIYDNTSASSRKKRRIDNYNNEVSAITEEASVAIAPPQLEEQQVSNFDDSQQLSPTQQFSAIPHTNYEPNSLYQWTGDQVIDVFDYADLWHDNDISCNIDLGFGLFKESAPNEAFWPAGINMELVERLVLTYIGQINPSMPVLRPQFLLDGLSTGRFLRARDFAACLLAVCAFICLQSHAATRSAALAKQFLTEAISLYNTASLGENPSVETVLACFLIFGSLWTLGSDNAAWLRLQEVINLARILKIDQLRDPGQDEDWQSKMQVYLGLVVVERAFAAGRDHKILLSKPTEHHLEAFTNQSAGLQLQELKNAAALRILVRSFGQLDDEVLVCWRNKCENIARPGSCERLSRARIARILQSFPEPKSHDWRTLMRADSESVGAPDDDGTATNERGDVILTSIWLQNRFWHLALTHGLLSANDSCRQLRFEFVSVLAREALEVCKNFKTSSFECHGQGLAEKVFDIASDHLGIVECFTGNANLREVFPDNAEEVLPPGPPIVREVNEPSGTPRTILSMETPSVEDSTKKNSKPSDFEIATGFLGFLAIFNNGRNTKFKQYLTKYMKFVAKAS